MRLAAEDALGRAARTTAPSSFQRINGAPGPIVISIAILVALATVSGFVLGERRLRWVVTLAVGIALAILSAVVQQSLGFEVLIGIPVVVACLTLNQGAYVIGLRMGDGEGGLRNVPYLGSKPTSRRATDAMMTFVTTRVAVR
jgi:hypothetical protein